MKASARIQVTLDVPIADVWHEHADLGQVRLDAIASGVRKLQEVLQGAGGGSSGVRIIGEPRVTIVLVEEL